MVNKTAIGILGVVVVASLGVGVLIGMQLGGGTGSPVSTSPADGGRTATPASDQTDDGGGDGTATPSESTNERQTTIPARQFDEEEIANHVAEFVNEERETQNRTRLATGDATATRVSRMASNHSVAMADHGSAIQGRRRLDHQPVPEPRPLRALQVQVAGGELHRHARREVRTGRDHLRRHALPG